MKKTTFRAKQSHEMIIPVYEEYGAIMWLWYCPFTDMSILKEWWGSLDCLNAYDLSVADILKGDVYQAITPKEKAFVDELYHHSNIKVMLETNEVSYLMIDNIKYGFKNMKSSIISFSNHKFTLSQAELTDIPSIVEVVNLAYQPRDKGTQGWTHEAHLIEGQRTNEDAVKTLILREHSTIFLLKNEALQTVATIHLQLDRASNHVHIGMFSVHPNHQNLGLGKQLLQHAETYAKEQLQATHLVMEVIQERTELLHYYLRRGYQLTGDTLAYDSLEGAGQSKVSDLQVIQLIKTLDEQA